MSSNRPEAVDGSLRARLDAVQLSRADRDAALRQLRFADGVARTFERLAAYLRRLTPATR